LRGNDKRNLLQTLFLNDEDGEISLELKLQKRLDSQSVEFGVNWMTSTEFLDTKFLGILVRNVLRTHQIGIEGFSKWVLGENEETASELLFNPKPWEVLND